MAKFFRCKMCHCWEKTSLGAHRARVQGAAGSAGFGTFLGHQFAMGFPLGALLGVLALVDGVGPLTPEVVAQGPMTIGSMAP